MPEPHRFPDMMLGMRRLAGSVFDPDPQSRYLDRFGWLLLLTYLTIAGQMLVNIEDQFGQFSQELGNLVAQVVGTAMLVLALYACGVARRWRRGLIIVATIGLVGRVLAIAVTGEAASELARDARLAPWGPLILMTLTFLFVCYRLTRHRRITSATLLGAITGYLLIPLVFYYAFLAVDAVQGRFFNEAQAGTDFMFFSLTTVTTLGYGKPTPATDVGQLLATTEALIGQLYLVVVVALIVGLMASNWGGRDDRD